MKNQWESELIHTFKMVHDGPFNLNPNEVETGRFWTLFEINKVLGTGIFTPNLEQEIALLKQHQLL